MGDTAGAMSILLGLHAANPADDDVAYWLAYLHYNADQAGKALALLSGRLGMNLPDCRFRLLEARSLVIQGDKKRALSKLEACQDLSGPDESLIAALMGVLLLEVGREAEGIAWIRKAGGNPWKALDGPLSRALPEAASARVIRVLQPMEAVIEVLVDAMLWEVDLQTGLARKSAGGREQTADEWGDEPGVDRTERVPCGEGLAWSSPSEPLDGGRGGVFRTIGGRLERVASSPAPGVDDRPSCAGGAVWFVRRLEGQSALIAARQGRDWEWSPQQGSLASVDARLDQKGRTQLLLGWVIEGDIGVWVTYAEPFKPVKVLGEEALSPRWVR